MRVLLRDLSPGQAYAIQFRSNDGDGNVSEWSQVQRFNTTNDTIRPGNVVNLSWYDSGSAFIGQWDKVVLDEQGNPLRDFRAYRCNVSSGGGAGADFYVIGERFEFTKAQNLATFGTVQTSLTLKVWAVDLTFNESNIPAQVTVNPLQPPTPSTPTISSFLGSVMVTWDGLNSGGTGMGSNFSYCEVHASTVSQFTPTANTLVGRMVADGSGSKYVIQGLPYGSLYYIRLIAVNEIGKRSQPSAQASGTATRVSGLDIANGSLTKDQINFTALDIGGANAFYQTSQPTSGMVTGDLWYDTDDQYEVYRYNGTTWVLAPEVGLVYSKKIVVGALTGDKIATNFFAAALARIGTAYIDEAYIQSVNAASIRTGSISADQRIIAGPELENHAEMTSTGFYVKGPQPGTPVGQTPNIIDRIRMGTGVSDFFAIPDPVDPDSTLAQIDENGNASFQGLYVDTDPTIQGTKLSTMIGKKANIVGYSYLGPITDLEPAGSAGIRSEYGIGQFNFPVVAGRFYEINARLGFWYVTNGGEAWHYLRVQQDNRTDTDIANGIAPTPVTSSSTAIFSVPVNGLLNNAWQSSNHKTTWKATFTGRASVGYSLHMPYPPASDSVIKVPNPSYLTLSAVDMGDTPADYNNGRRHNQGGALYSYTPPPPPAVQPQNFYWEGRYNWARSWKGNGAWMTNDGGKVYQGTDPSGYNGNQYGAFGFSNADFASMLSGAYNISVHVYLYFAHWYYNAGGTARVGYTSQWGDPAGGGLGGGIAGTFDSSGWPKPGARELDISGWAGAFQNGSARGIVLGPGNNGYQNYGYATDCVLKFWYTKNV
jgi:hypothetical protein